MSWNDSEDYTPQWSRFSVWLGVMIAVVLPALLLGMAALRWLVRLFT